MKQLKYEANRDDFLRSEALAKAQKPDMRFPEKVENKAYIPAPVDKFSMYPVYKCSEVIIKRSNEIFARCMSTNRNTPTLDQVITATTPKPTPTITTPAAPKVKHAYLTHPDNVKNMQIALPFESHLTFICTLIRVEKYNQDIAKGVTGDKLLKVYRKAPLTLKAQDVMDVMKNANVQGGMKWDNVTNSRGGDENTNEFKIIPIKPSHKTTKGLYKGTFVV